MINFFISLFSNQWLVSAFIAWLLAQLLKGLLYALSGKKMDASRFVGAGGMPSSHSSLVTALAMSIALTNGVNSLEFAIAAVCCFVTIYDACGVRYAVGEQAKILNQIIVNFATDDPSMRDSRLKEFLGHTKFEVIAGCLLGISVSLVYYFIMLISV